jgi:chromosome segregation ATPase
MANGEHTPNRAKWPDVALDERFRATDRELELIRESLEQVSVLPHELAQVLNRLEDRLETAMRDRDGRLTKAIAAVAKTCSDFQGEYREDRKEWRRENESRSLTRTQMAVGLAIATLALIGAVVAALITSHSL